MDELEPEAVDAGQLDTVELEAEVEARTLTLDELLAYVEARTVTLEDVEPEA